METTFTPVQSLAGGAMIGLSAVLLMGTLGRIAGISGIVARLLPPGVERGGRWTGAAFVLGLLLAVPVHGWASGAVPAGTMVAAGPLLALAGLLVGFGAVTGNGCTSGHGVCGLSRLSGRSAVATGTFMATAFATVLVLRHLGGM